MSSRHAARKTKMFKQCEKYFRAHCHVLVVLVLLSILGTAVSIVSPYITGNIITDISSGHSLFPILHKCKVLLLLFLLSHAMGVFSSVLKLKIELSMGTGENPSRSVWDFCLLRQAPKKSV